MLNSAQQQAVEAIEGPVLVIAGPGTGKTHLLAHRVAHILTVTDADASNILCLTFSDSGVSAMRKRLKSIIGLDANKIHVMTFHGFCNKVILENQDFLGVSNFQPAVDLERMEVIRHLLARLDPANPLSRASGRVYSYERHLAHLFSWLKRENQDWKKVKAACEEYAHDLEAHPDFIYQRNSKYGKKGDPNLNKISEERERIEKTIAGLDLFEAYNKAMERRSLYDYDDMIQWVLGAFNRGENLLRRYQEQYLYILVDEFQDTNSSQFDLVKKLADFWEVPNLFIVGDDDQSIFEFQGARLKNLTDFVRDYSPEVIVLDENYRSGQEILDLSAKVIGNNQARLVNLGYDKNLTAVSHQDAAVYLMEFDTLAAEATYVIDEARASIQAGTTAILYSKHRQVQDLVKYMQNKNIPFSARYTNDVFRTKVWKFISAYFEYVNKELDSPGKGDYLIFDLLHFPMSGWSRRDIVELAKRVKVTNAQRAEENKEYTRQTYFEALEGSPFGDLLGDLVSKYHESTLLEWFDHLLRATGILSGLSWNHFELTAIKTVWNFIAGQVTKSINLSLPELMDLFQGMQENSIPFRVEVSARQDGVIELCSAHGAKGLEWDCVIMYDCSSAWEPGRGHAQFKLPPTVTYSGDTDADEASRRAFYVAMTRAKGMLILTRALVNPDGKDRKAAKFFDEIEQTPDHVDIPEEAISEYLLGVMGPSSSDPYILPADELNELIERFVLSPSSLNDYLECPLTFYYKHLLGVPYFESEASQFGYVLHEPLAMLFRKSRHNDDRSFHSVDYFLEWYTDAMTKARSKFTKDGYRRLLPHGAKVLSEYYHHHLASWPHHTQAEYRITNVMIAGVPFKGIIDRMDFQDANAVKVVDYKTGKYRREDFESASEGTNGGKYWRQLCGYKMLVDNDPRESWYATGAKISFVEPQDGKFLDIEVDVLNGAHLVEDIIKTAWQGITNHEFQGCKDPDCKFCNL